MTWELAARVEQFRLKTYSDTYYQAGTPLILNFIGDFLSLYGIFERLPILGALASFSIVFSAASKLLHER